MKVNMQQLNSFDQRFIYVNLNARSPIVTPHQIPGESFKSHDVIDVYAYKVENNPKGVNVSFVSRSHPELSNVSWNKKFLKHFDEL